MSAISVDQTHLLSARYNLLVGDSRSALDNLNEALGFLAPQHLLDQFYRNHGGTFTVGPEPEPPRKHKIALLIGHNVNRQGAWSVGAIRMSEWDFNNRVADYLVAKNDGLIEYKKFHRWDHGRYEYKKEIAEAYQRVEREFAPDYTIELHFNFLTDNTRTEMFHSSVANSKTIALAENISESFAEVLNIRDGGAKVLQKNDRGGRGLYMSSVPSILTEPFPGNDPKTVATVAALSFSGIADIYDLGIRQTIEAW